MSDLIRREDAISVLKALEESAPTAQHVSAIFDCEDTIKGLPSAESERKKGKWQRRKGSDCWECSKCHAVLENDDLGMHNFYFCYHCGADMMNKSGYMDIEEVYYE